MWIISFFRKITVTQLPCETEQKFQNRSGCLLSRALHGVDQLTLCLTI